MWAPYKHKRSIGQSVSHNAFQYVLPYVHKNEPLHYSNTTYSQHREKTLTITGVAVTCTDLCTIAVLFHITRG